MRKLFARLWADNQKPLKWRLTFITIERFFSWSLAKHESKLSYRVYRLLLLFFFVLRSNFKFEFEFWNVEELYEKSFSENETYSNKISFSQFTWEIILTQLIIFYRQNRKCSRKFRKTTNNSSHVNLQNVLKASYLYSYLPRY